MKASTSLVWRLASGVWRLASALFPAGEPGRHGRIGLASGVCPVPGGRTWSPGPYWFGLWRLLSIPAGKPGRHGRIGLASGVCSVPGGQTWSPRPYWFGVWRLASALFPAGEPGRHGRIGLASGVWRLASGVCSRSRRANLVAAAVLVWRLASGVWRLASDLSPGSQTRRLALYTSGWRALSPHLLTWRPCRQAIVQGKVAFAIESGKCRPNVTRTRIRGMGSSCRVARPWRQHD
jgi:hypothetical protein